MSDNTLPPLNVPLLRDLVTWAAADQEALDSLAEKFPGWGEWDQNVWAKEVRNGVCKSAYCIAGQAVVQIGMGLDLYTDDEDEDGYTLMQATHCAPKRFVGLDDHGLPKYELDESRREYISDVARRALGLTPTEGELLFSGGNGVSRVVSYALMFAEARGVDLGLPPEVAELRLEDAADEDYARGYLGYPPATCAECGQPVPAVPATA